jgi:hypothetical protein
MNVAVFSGSGGLRARLSAPGSMTRDASHAQRASFLRNPNDPFLYVTPLI